EQRALLSSAEQLLSCLPRLALLLDSIPTADEEEEDSEFFFFFKTSSGHTNELPLDGKNSVKWQEAQSAVSSCEGRCRSLIGSLTSHLKQESQDFFVEEKILNDSAETLRDVQAIVKSVAEELPWSLEDTLGFELKIMLEPIPMEEVGDVSSGDASSVIHSLQLAIQELYKTFSSLKNEEAEFPQQNHLTGVLMDCLSNAWSELRLGKIVDKIQGFLQDPEVTEADASVVLGYLDEVLNVVEALMQKMFALHHSSCHLLYALSRIFTELCLKGFCLPQESPPDSGEGGDGGSGKEIEGPAGLGEGKGEKDVSGRIETQDEVEDLKRDDEEEQVQSDAEEAEDGVEMEDDFGGGAPNTGDVKGKEEEVNEDEDEDDEEGMEKKMDDVEEEEQEIDQELWRDEEGEEDKDRKEKDGEGGGEEIGEEEMAAKGATEDEGGQGERKEKGKEPQLNEESGEPDPNQKDNFAGE
ncbi:unnamed protein product, partial [Cyprideis torosa]